MRQKPAVHEKYMYVYYSRTTQEQPINSIHTFFSFLRFSNANLMHIASTFYTFNVFIMILFDNFLHFLLHTNLLVSTFLIINQLRYSLVFRDLNYNRINMEHTYMYTPYRKTHLHTISLSILDQ
mgnify:CR=1 FL=1